MISLIMRRLPAFRVIPKQQMLLQIKSIFSFANQGSPFKFYSFEEEIHKLKAAQESMKKKQSLGSEKPELHGPASTALKKVIDELNHIYREGKMFNFTVDNDYISTEISPKLGNKIKDPKNNQLLNGNAKTIETSDTYYLSDSTCTNEALYIVKSLKLVIKAIQSELSIHEKAVVLEIFLHNVLLAVLCDSQQLHLKIQQNLARGPLVDEMRCLSRFLEKIAQSDEGMRIMQESVNLFKFTVKCFEVFHIRQRIAIPCIQKYVNFENESVSNISEISQLLLPISDYIHEIGSSIAVDNYKLDMSILSNKLRLILKSRQGKKNTRDEVNILCKTLFCMVRINNGKGKVCIDLADSLLGSSYESLPEIEMTSLIYSLSKLQYDKEEEILFERKIKREMPNLLFDYETKVEKMLQNRYFNYTRVPFILYCLQNSSKYRPAHRKNQLGYLCRSLYVIANKNYEKYKASEITTIIYSLKMLNPAFQAEIEQLYRAYFLKLALDKQKKDQEIAMLQKQNSKQNNEKNADEIINDLEDKEEQVNLQPQTDKQFNQEMVQGLLTVKNVPEQSIVDSKTQKVSQQNSIKKMVNSSLKQQQFQQQQPQQQLSRSESPKTTSTPPQISSNINLKSSNKPSQQNQGFNIKMQKVRNTIVYFEQLQPVDILCLFIGIRNNERWNSNSNSNSNTNNLNGVRFSDSKVNSIFVINQQLFQLFLSKQGEISNNLKIKILYEVSYNHSELLDSYLFEKYFSDWIGQITNELQMLNTHDFIALAFIMKKFARLFAYHIDFWIKFNDELTKRSFIHQVEISKIRLVIQNMHDFYYKCLNSPPSLKKEEKNRTKKLQLVFDKLCASQSRIHQINLSKEHGQSDDEEFNFDRSY